MLRRIGELPDSVLLMILNATPLGHILSARAASKGLRSIVSRLFRYLFPTRRIQLDRALKHNARWASGGPEQRTLDGLRVLHSGPAGKVSVSIVAKVDNGAVFPTNDQVNVLTHGFLESGDQVHLRVRPLRFQNCKYDFDRLCGFREFLASLSVEAGPLNIGQIGVLVKALPPTLERLSLSGVTVPLATAAPTEGKRAAKDATKHVSKLLTRLPALTDLNLARTRLDVSLLTKALCAMPRMKRLDLSSTRYMPEHAVTVLSHMPGLASLTLGYTYVDHALAAVVFSLPLETLSLPCCMITDAGMLSSAASMGPATIELLDISWNRVVSARDVSALIRALPKLRKMNLCETLANHDELAPMLLEHPSAMFSLTYPTQGSLADDTVQRHRFIGTNLRYFPPDSGP